MTTPTPIPLQAAAPQLTPPAATQSNGRLDGAYVPMPLWLSIPLLLVCLFVGGFIIRWYINTGALAKETSILGVVPPDGRNRYLQLQKPPADKPNVTIWEAKTELGEADFVITKGQAPAMSKLEFARFGRNPGGAAPPASARPAIAALEGATVADHNKQVKRGTPLTSEQQKVLDDLALRGGTSNLRLNDADKARLLADFAAFESADENGKILAEIKVLETLDQVATTDLQNRFEKLKSVLTPDQMAELPKLAQQQRGGNFGNGGRGGPPQ